MLNIIIFGPPGAGKGTQSEHIKERYDLTYISTGQVLRAEMAAGTEIGLTSLFFEDIIIPPRMLCMRSCCFRKCCWYHFG